VRHLLRIDDLTDRDVGELRTRATALAAGAEPDRSTHRILGAVFLEGSLRTRVGFAAAAHRLGWDVIEVLEARSGPSSVPERWQDTLRVVAGSTDCMVCRPGIDLGAPGVGSLLTTPTINAGDTGPGAEHPVQALVDMFSWERMVGPTEELHITIRGDLRMRAVRSLLHLLGRTRPATLTLMSISPLDEADLPDSLADRTRRVGVGPLTGTDVLYVAGMPHESLPESDRSRLRLGVDDLATLPAESVVLSPMPVIDEIDEPARDDPRVRMYEQSDFGTFVRTALLEALTDPNWEEP
jgi:aspartate carbamoyltransferase catalytic subunit